MMQQPAANQNSSHPTPHKDPQSTPKRQLLIGGIVVVVWWTLWAIVLPRASFVTDMSAWRFYAFWVGTVLMAIATVLYVVGLVQYRRGRTASDETTATTEPQPSGRHSADARALNDPSQQRWRAATAERQQRGRRRRKE